VNQLELIQQPILKDLKIFGKLFAETLSHPNFLLDSVLKHIRNRKGKQMRPSLLFLVAHEYGKPTDATYLSAVMLELLHTASLIHDDVVDDSNERRGQSSVNAMFDNKLAVLVGDYLLSSSLQKAALTHDIEIVERISVLGKKLAFGEIQQLSNKAQEEFSTLPYLEVIKQKTASLFATTAAIAAISVGVSKDVISLMDKLGENIGMCFQIKDDIFDYFDNPSIGKPTGNDMLEGKLTLPVLSVLIDYPNEKMHDFARKVRKGEATQEEIASLVDYTKKNGGVEAAEKVMHIYSDNALKIIANFKNADVKNALENYVNFVIDRSL